MAGKIDEHLAELGIELPQAASAVANYIPCAISGNLVFVSGQVPLWNGELRHVGKLGDDTSLDDGYQAARLCGLNLIAQLKAGLGGNLDRVKRVVKLSGFVNCTPDFTDQPKVVNGASDLMVDIFGDRGRHARFAVGAPSLPLGVAVEVDGIFEIE